MTDLNKLRQVEEYKQRDLNSDTGEECPLDPVEEAKILIVDKITKHFQDIMFEMVCEEMGKNYLFQSQNYFTDAGYDQFEDEWFEFYHEHHGDILYEVMQNITD
jgi:hypoxanthine phosphoribosyltransferase